MTNRTKDHGENISVDIVSNAFWLKCIRMLRKNNLAINHTKSVLLPDKGEYLIFKTSKD